jgi:hypothetical protein
VQLSKLRLNTDCWRCAVDAGEGQVVHVQTVPTVPHQGSPVQPAATSIDDVCLPSSPDPVTVGPNCDLPASPDDNTVGNPVTGR